MDALTSWLLGYLLNASWQLPLFFVAAWCIVRLLRSADVALHHRIWVGTLLLQCFLPACSCNLSIWLREIIHVMLHRHGGTSGNISVEFGPGTAAGTMHLSTHVHLAGTLLCAVFLLYVVLRFFWRN